MISLALLSQPGETNWILVANGSKANVYTAARVERNGAPNDPGNTSQLTLKKIDGMSFTGESLERFDLNHHKPARRAQIGTPTPSMSEPHETAQEHIRHDLAADIAKALNEKGEKGAFTKLVLVASPSILNDIKRHLNKRCEQSVIATFSADLTHFENSALLDRLNHLFHPDALAS